VEPLRGLRDRYGYAAFDELVSIAATRTALPAGPVDEGFVEASRSLWHLRVIPRPDGTRGGVPAIKLGDAPRSVACGASRDAVPGVPGGEANVIHVCDAAYPLWHRLGVEAIQAPGLVSWTPWGEVDAQTGRHPEGYDFIAADAARGDLHLCAVMTGERRLYHTVRHVDGSWTPWVDVDDAAGALGWRFDDVAVLAE
jgi:hypothetical protein